jgi:hypothetical protein
MGTLISNYLDFFVYVSHSLIHIVGAVALFNGKHALNPSCCCILLLAIGRVTSVSV